MRQIPEIAEPEGLSKTHVFAAALSLALLVGAGFGLAVGQFLPANATKEAAAPIEPRRAAGPVPLILGPQGAAPAAGYAAAPTPTQRAQARLPGQISDALDLPLEDSITATRAEPISEPVVVASAAAVQTAPPVTSEQPTSVAADAPRPRIAVVMDDLGLDETSTRRAIALPAAVTLSFLPYGKSAPGLAEEARARGHEIMAHIPMQPEGPEDPGPNALRVDLPADDISARLAAQLDKFPGAIGFNNHMGSRFTADVRSLLPVMREARARGLIFLDSRTTANSLAAKIAKAAGTETLTRDVFLDHATGPDGLLSQLAELERIARMSGGAIGIAHPHDLTLDVLDVWTRGLAAKGFDLVPVSVMVRGKRDQALLAASGL